MLADFSAAASVYSTKFIAAQFLVLNTDNTSMKKIRSNEIESPLLQESLIYGAGQRSKDSMRKPLPGHLPLSAMTYAQARTITRLRSSHTMPTTEPWLSRLASYVAGYCSSLRRRPVLMPLKAGFAACTAAYLRFVPGALSFLNKNGVWAVITSDIVLEPTVGLTFSKGINRAAGTIVAASLAFAVDHAARAVGETVEPYLLLFFTFLGGAIPSAFKFRKPFRDRWNYAVVMSMITFHLLILSKGEFQDKVKLPLVRILTIVFGFVIASTVNWLILPEYAADGIHVVLSNNFSMVGSVVERCVSEYCSGSVLEQIPDLLGNGKLPPHDDELHLCFHEILAADSEIDKLRGAVNFEPSHGKFFWGYPWFIYDDLTDNLRHLLYDVVALDSCLRAEIQAPIHYRKMFQDDMLAIGSHISQVMRSIGQSIKHMRHFDCVEMVHKGEEYALLLQHKLAKSIPEILRETDDPLTGKPNATITGPTNRPDTIEISLNDEHHPDLAAIEPSQGLEHQEERLHHLLAAKAEELQKGHHSISISSINSQWDIVANRIAALSVIKFASILIELVAKAKYVVEVMDELALKACFDGVSSDHI